ncbi:MAG TPA: ethanolamine ammonia-lyase subunit EutC [Silvibacterium sp.]|nr:ethanolamine ammonia-lyase subunit EutC [Silvibacterium sp.]
MTSDSLRRYTTARVGLRRAGSSLATSELLEMAQCLAEARDAVHAELSSASLVPQLTERGFHTLCLKSAARDRTEYLRRPDLGRQLSEASRALLKPDPGCVAIAIADGLSAIAAERHAMPVLDELLPLLGEGWGLGPVAIAEQARVAIGDEIGERLKAEVMLLLIGERPGLSSPDSLGAYITWAPRVGRSDAERNCVSNIRPEGLSYSLAARKIASYLNEARRRKLTGVALKEELPQLER